MTDAPDSFHGDEIAVIGMACRLPGAPDVQHYWRNLREGAESITFYTEEELRAAGVGDALLANPEYVRSGGGRIDGIELFDAGFFGLVPKEAELLDPQHRLFLELAHTGLEDAGYDPATYDGLIGVFAGAGRANYLLQNLASNPDLLEAVGPVAATLASDRDFLPTRVSYLLDLKGPSINVQTACSTSLVATHLACQSLLTGECDVALAGGSSITTLATTGYLWHEGSVYSNDGHCRAFDANASGMVGGNGLALVVLKRLEAALEDGDAIRAVIKGSAINNDGSAKVGFTAPGVDGQAEVIAQALAAGEIDPRTVTFVETHGTGTALGDPIEVAALTKAFGAPTDKPGHCALGAVKTNIGHTNAAAGAAGLIKAALALQHGELPPTLHFDQANPDCDLDKSPFYVNTELRDWQTEGHPRRAGVSSFGMGGTNAHVVLEQAPTPAASGPSRATKLLVLSAKTESALDTATSNLAEHLRSPGELDLADVAYTLQVGRTRMPHRRIALGGDPAQAATVLTSGDPERTSTGLDEATERPVVFMFPGQGAQHIHMGRELYDSEPLFRADVDQCCELLKPHLGLDLRDLLYPGDADAELATERLTETRHTQPALFVIEYALARLWMSWGVKPAGMIGHSIGEYVAACLASVLSLEDALQLVAARGAMMQALPAGDMLSVALPEDEVTPLLGDELSLAAVNGPALCVVSGPAGAVANLQEQLNARDVTCRVLHTSHAFHSSMMDDIVEPFAAKVAGVQLSPATIPCVSTVTGDWIQPADWAEPDYWASNLRQPVRFADGARALLAGGKRALLEVGPGTTLGGLVRMQPDAAGRTVISSMRHVQDGRGDLDTLLWAVGRLWISGVSVDWAGFNGDTRRQRVPLPTYPFESERYWVDAGDAGGAAAPSPAAAATAKKQDVGDWFYLPSWQRSPAPTAGSPQGRWLLVEDEAGLGDRLAEHLSGVDVVRARAGDGFSQADDGAYTFDLSSRADHGALLDAISSTGGPLTRVVHLCNVVRDGADEADLSTLASAQARAFDSLLYLVQGIGEKFADESIHLQIVSNDLFDVTGDAGSHAERALALGPCRVIPHEYENLTCAHVDVQLDDPLVIERITAECTEPASEAVAAYRGAHRWIQAFAPARLAPAEPSAAWRRAGGVFLLTGGLGGMGLTLADHLAGLDDSKLVLLSRSGLPDRDAWDAHLDAHDGDRTSRQIRAVRALEARGAEVLVAAADVADAAAVAAVVQAATERFGPIRGVVHAAGTSTGGMMALRTAEAAAEVLDPKVAGTMALKQALREQPLEFFALCSSLASVQGGVGAADYCGANAFLDALAQTADPTPFVTLSWDAWSEVGMAAETDVPEALREERARYLALGVSCEEGAEVFARAVSSSHRHVYVSTRDLTARLAHEAGGADTGAPVDDAASDQATAPASAAPKAAGHARPDLPNPYVAPKTDAEKKIADAWREVLGVGEPGVNDNFFELGGHSLLLWQLHGMLRKQFDTEITIADLFAHPTISALAQHATGDDKGPAFDEAQDRAAKQRAAMGRRGKAARKGPRSQ